MPTGANGQDWLARSQIWLVVAIRNEAHTVSKHRGRRRPRRAWRSADSPSRGWRSWTARRRPRDGFALSTQRRRAVGAL